MADWADLLTQGLNIGAAIYTGQLQKKAARKAAKANAFAGSPDFPQLGFGLGASGPQRMMYSGGGGGDYLPAAYDVTPTGGGSMGDVSSGSSSTAMMPRGMVYAIGRTANGGQRVLAMRSAGTPLLWSGDLAAVRRVARVARKLGRFVHHRRPR